MPWVRLEDTFYDHPKVLAAGLAAVGLHIVALCYSSAKLTDGFVSPRILAYLHGTPRLAAKLVQVGLWETSNGGWLIHDYLDYNPSKAATNAHRQKVSEERAKAGKAGGIASAIAKQRGSKGDGKDGSNGQAPTLPVPTQPNAHVAREEILGTTEDEADLFAFIAQHGAFIRPESGFGVRLLGLIERRGVEAVMEKARELDTGEALSDRQWVFGLEKALEAIPSPPMDELLPETGPTPRDVRRQERVEAARLEYFRETGRWDPDLGPEPEWQDDWGIRPKATAA